MSRHWFLAGAIAGGVVVAGCGEDALRPGRNSAAIVAADSVLLHSLGQLLTVPFQILSDSGLPVEDTVPHLEVTDGAIATLVSANDSGVVLRAETNGSTILRISLGALSKDVTVTVSQIPVSLELGWADTLPIRTAPAGAPLPLACVALDSNGIFLDQPALVEGRTGVVVGSACNDLRSFRSGFDTLTVRAGSLEQTIPVIIALQATVTPSLGEPLQADSVPAGMFPWAPTLIDVPGGSLDLYFTGYLTDSTSPTHLRGDLHRFRSQDDGATFQYDGVALTRDSTPCSPTGDGIENVAVAPRAEGGGFRMFYASGGFTCYGWQVFSAVSPDQTSWTREPGVRLSNGGTLPPAPPITPPWPAGEGMVIDQLPSGEWRMIAGTYQNVLPVEDKFQITEWRSPDQLSWSYVGGLLLTDDIGPEAQRSIYSPTIREVVPGLYRMVFTGDNLNVPGGRSRLHTAVSLDRASWQYEGQLMGSEATDIFYSTLVDDLLVFIRQDLGQDRHLASARVTMP